MTKTKINIDHDKDYSKLEPLISKINSGKEFEKNNSIFIFGTPGVGKTHFLKSLLKRVNDLSKTFINMVDWINTYQKTWSLKDFEGVYIVTPEKLAKTKILLIDDFGAELIKDSTTSYIYKLLDQRYEYIKNSKKSITVFTSNFSLEEIEKIYYKKLDKVMAERLISRLRGLIDLVINFEGSDKRQDVENNNVIFEQLKF